MNRRRHINVLLLPVGVATVIFILINLLFVFCCFVFKLSMKCRRLRLIWERVLKTFTIIVITPCLCASISPALRFPLSKSGRWILNLHNGLSARCAREGEPDMDESAQDSLDPDKNWKTVIHPDACTVRTLLAGFTLEPVSHEPPPEGTFWKMDGVVLSPALFRSHFLWPEQTSWRRQWES